jgi:hypothetical protein
MQSIFTELISNKSAPAAFNSARLGHLNFMAGDDLSRNVYCVLGMPIDVSGMPSVLCDIEAAAASRAPLFISTHNPNLIINMQSDAVNGRDELGQHKSQ